MCYLTHFSGSYFFLDLLVVSIDVAILCVEFFGEAKNPRFHRERYLSDLGP